MDSDAPFDFSFAKLSWFQLAKASKRLVSSSKVRTWKFKSLPALVEGSIVITQASFPLNYPVDDVSPWTLCLFSYSLVSKYVMVEDISGKTL